MTRAAPTPVVAPGWPARLLAPAGVGVLAGVAAKVADESSWRWAADLGSFPAAWVLAVALLGRAAGSPRSAAVAAAVGFTAMTVAYYAWAALVLGFGWTLELPVWLVLSVTAVPVFAVVVQESTRRAGALPGALLAVASGVVLARGAVGRLPDGDVRPVQLVADVVVAVLVCGVLPRHRSTRAWALALTLPLAVLFHVVLALR